MNAALLCGPVPSSVFFSLVADREFLASFCSSFLENSASVFSGHSFAETVLVASFSAAGLECSFHPCVRKLFVSCFSKTTNIRSCGKNTKWNLILLFP